jgi:hypothetical protein
MTSAIKSSIAVAMKQNLLPGLVLQLFAALILILYFFVPSSKPVFVWFGDLKQTYGYLYSFISTSLFGGLIPFVFLSLTKKIDRNKNIAVLFIFYILFWGLRGIEVDFFYRLQGDWFGYANNFHTTAMKVAVDQFLYTTLWAAPSITVIYLWIEHNFHFRDCFQAINRHFIFIKIPAVILSNWLVWIPAVSIIYSMPNELQIPLFNLVLCFWVLLLNVLNRPSSPNTQQKNACNN